MIQLAKGLVEEVEEKGHANVLKLTSTLDGEKLMYLALPDAHVYSKWYRKCKKVRCSCVLVTTQHGLWCKKLGSSCVAVTT